MSFNSILDRFDKIVNLYPEKVAIKDNGTILTYLEVKRKAESISISLALNNIKKGDIVGIDIDRSLATILTIIGVLKTGAIYVCISEENRKNIVSHTLPKIIIYDKSDKLHKYYENNYNISFIPYQLLDEKQNVEKYIKPSIAPADSAFIIFTSGSTGNPKGVISTHENLSWYVYALNKRLKITQQDIYLHSASMNFSSSNRQLFLPLSIGASIYLLSEEERNNPLKCLEVIQLHKLTIVDFTPSYASIIADIMESIPDDKRGKYLKNNIRLFLFASEDLTPKLLERILKLFSSSIIYINMYGMTETTGIVATYKIPHTSNNEEMRLIPIGTPLEGVKLVIKNKTNNTGVLQISGKTLSKGYLEKNRSGNISIVDYPNKCIDTGDTVFFDKKKGYYKIGRFDHIFKINGIKIAPYEIDSEIENIENITKAVTICKNINNEKRLITFYTTNNGKSIERDSIILSLKRQLPTYKIPTSFIHLNKLPLLCNGKIDYTSLYNREHIRISEGSQVFEDDNIVNALKEIWEDILSTKIKSSRIDYFELGGNSLSILKMIGLIYEKLEVEISIIDIFTHSTIKKLAKLIKQKKETK